MDAEQLRSAENAGLSVVCGSIAFDDAALDSLGVNAQSDGNDIVQAAVLLSYLFTLEIDEAASSLADLVQEMK
jgi:hypothetical protein